MPFRAFYIDTGVEVSEQDLLALGVEHFQINADQVDKEGTEPTLEKICIERNYNYKDVVSIIVRASLVIKNILDRPKIIPETIHAVINSGTNRSTLPLKPCLITKRR